MNVYPNPTAAQCDDVNATRARLGNATDRRTRVPSECQREWVLYDAACRAAGVRTPPYWQHYPRPADNFPKTHHRDRIAPNPPATRAGSTETSTR